MSKNQGKGFIKHYDSITAMLKTIFYYGTYSEKDMKAEKGFEHSKYHDDMITIRYVFGDMLVEHTNEAGKKAYSLRNDYFEDPQRLFTKFFALRSIAMDKLKRMFPEKQIILLTPIHRAFATFGAGNIQPEESYPNRLGLYIHDYVEAIKETANVWSVPVIDLNALCGLNPMIEEHAFAPMCCRSRSAAAPSATSLT